ncbi:hypothetical protein IJ707_04790 [bacterium]|nr:hypothetical protein [bacterium]
MKKIIFILAIFIIGSITFAENLQEEQEPKQEESSTATTTPVEENRETLAKEPEYTTVIRGSQTFYYDKQGKLIAHDKTLKNQTFFYNKTGQLIGKSVERNEKKYYYNSINKFLGVCENEDCFDSDFVSTGKIPPLPEIKSFKPVIDNDIINPKADEIKKEKD